MENALVRKISAFPQKIIPFALQLSLALSKTFNWMTNNDIKDYKTVTVFKMVDTLGNKYLE